MKKARGAKQLSANEKAWFARVEMCQKRLMSCGMNQRLAYDTVWANLGKLYNWKELSELEERVFIKQEWGKPKD